jgi:hypothetical protein
VSIIETAFSLAYRVPTHLVRAGTAIRAARRRHPAARSTIAVKLPIECTPLHAQAAPWNNSCCI